jgi:hypothetical protein
VLSLAVRAGWDDGSGGPVRFLRRGDRIVRALPAELAAALPPEVLDVTDDVEAFDVTLGIRSRFDRVTWRLPAEPRVEFEQVDDGAVTPVARMTTQVDLAHSAMGRPLEPALWDLYAAIRWQGLSRSAAVRSELPALAALVDGRPAVGYANKRGNLSLDAKGDLRNVVKDARPGTGDVTGTVERFVVTLPHIHVRGAAELGGEVTFVPVSSRGGHAGGTKAVVPARVLADAQGARLEAGGRVPPGRYRLAFRVADGVPLESDFVASVSEDGEFDVVRQPRPVEVPSLRTRLERGWSDLTSRIRTRSAAQVAHRG